MRTLTRLFMTMVLPILLAQLAAGQEEPSPGYNVLPNAGFMVAGSGFAPDWWNWYGGTARDDWPDCWQPVEEHYIPGTRSIRLTNGAGLLTSYLRVYFQKDTTLTLSVYLKSDRPDTKVTMHLGGWEGINDVTEVTVGTEWQRYHVTGTTKSKLGRPFMWIRLEGEGPLWVNAPQLEEGSAPTEWKLSLKDMAKEDEAEEPAAPKFAIPEIDCLKIDKAPVIDGTLDDAAWKEAAATENFMRLDEDRPAEHPTDTYICRDDENIYIAFRCHEPEMDKLTATQTLYDAVGIFQDDCVEVFISGNEDGSDCLRFAANARGTKLDSKGFSKFFDTEWECATSKGEDFWSIEFRLPLSSLERPLQPGTPWRLNLCRFRARPKKEEYSAWAPVVRTFHDSAHFGLVYGIIAQVSRRTKEEAPADKLIAYLDRSFYTTEQEAKLFVNAPVGTEVRFALNGSQHQESLPEARLVPIDLSALATGEYPLEVRVGERKVELVLMKLPPKENAVKIERIHRILLVDGKPFMPFGITSSARSVKLQAKMGFNCPYASMHTDFTEKAQKRLREALDAAQANGVRMIAWYGNARWRDDRAKYEAELLKVVKMFKDHPALLAWWVFDEPVSNIKWLKGLCESVKKADPYHPVFVNWCDRGHGWTREMGDVTGDVNCNDGYYLNCYEYTPNEAFLLIGKEHCTDMTADAKRAGRVVAYINGVHGWTSGIREPSPAENRFITYVCLIRGARMLLYYTWGPPMNMALRDSFPGLSQEMATLTPVVANPEVKEKVTCDNPRIDYTAFQAEDGLCVIALNTDVDDEEVTFRIAGAKGKARVLFEDRQITITNGVLKDTFKPIERHVYHVTDAFSG